MTRTTTLQTSRALEMWILGFVRAQGSAEQALAYATAQIAIDPQWQWWQVAATYIRCAYRLA